MGGRLAPVGTGSERPRAAIGSNYCQGETTLMRRFARSISLCAAWLPLAAAPAAAHLVSTTADEVIDGKNFFAGDIFAAEKTPGNSGLYLSATIFDEDGVDLDAMAMLPNGHLVLSVGNDEGATLAGVAMEDGDLAEYDPATGAASIFLSEDVFGTNLDVDAVEVLANGHVLLSFRRDETVVGTLYLDGDIVRYDPVAGTFAVEISEATLGGGDVDALAWRGGTGHYLISARDDVTLGGVTINDGDLFDYDPVSGAAFIVLSLDSRTSFGGSDIDAVINGGPLPCSDGLDNDGDGLTDFGGDPGCDAAGDFSEAGTAPCDDGADNDGDGYIDYPADPVCTTLATATEYGQCQDGNDNDHDGMIDFDGGLSIYGPGAPELRDPDPRCSGDPSQKERASSCGLGFELALVLPLLAGLRAARRRVARG